MRRTQTMKPQKQTSTTAAEDPELKHINALLGQLAGFSDQAVRELEPENWKNVGISVVDAFMTLKEHLCETNANLTQLLNF